MRRLFPSRPPWPLRSPAAKFGQHSLFMQGGSPAGLLSFRFTLCHTAYCVRGSCYRLLRARLLAPLTACAAPCTAYCVRGSLHRLLRARLLAPLTACAALVTAYCVRGSYKRSCARSKRCASPPRQARSTRQYQLSLPTVAITAICTFLQMLSWSKKTCRNSPTDD